MSSRIKSGFSSSAFWTASNPSSASATTLRSGRDRSMSQTCFRHGSKSSTSKIRHGDVENEFRGSSEDRILLRCELSYRGSLELPSAKMRHVDCSPSRTVEITSWWQIPHNCRNQTISQVCAFHSLFNRRYAVKSVATHETLPLGDPGISYFLAGLARRCARGLG